MIFCFLFDSIVDKFKTSKVKLFSIIPKTVTMAENQTNKILQNGRSILITGGSGLIGKYLTSYLLDSGYKVSHLSRIANQSGNVKTYIWDPEKGMIDREAIVGIDFIIHLAGTNIGAKRWSCRRKEEIINSRVNSARLLDKTIKEMGIRLNAFITASATGFYGSDTSEKIFNENDEPSAGFLSEVCKQWEEAADLIADSGIRTVKIRTGIVLEKHESALSKLMMPGRFGFLIQMGSGNQYVPWIHIDDLCGIYLKAIEDSEMNGSYNAVAPQHITHSGFMHVLSKAMNRPLSPVNVPEFVLRFTLGELSDVILKGNRISSEKIIKSGYSFQFSTLEEVLNNIIRG
jgi:uncharacterized protein